MYGVALAGRKPAAMRVHNGDKKLFLLSTPCIVNRRPAPFPTPIFSYYLALGNSLPRFPIFCTRRLPPLISITSPLLVSITSLQPTFSSTSHVWVWVGRTPVWEASASDSKKSPLLIVTTNPWGGVISTSHRLRT
jgi:hypothetical protein